MCSMSQIQTCWGQSYHRLQMICRSVTSKLPVYVSQNYLEFANYRVKTRKAFNQIGYPDTSDIIDHPT